jgi:hypothetical protein
MSLDAPDYDRARITIRAAEQYAPVGSMWCHDRHEGVFYCVRGYAILQISDDRQHDMRVCVLYGAAGCESWVRPFSEFHDRFTRCP